MTISATLKTEAWSVESDLPLILLTIAHADLASDITVVNNNEDIISNSVTFTAFPFEVGLPKSTGDGVPRASLRISNVAREIGQAIRNITTPATVTIQVVRQDAPDTVEVELPNLRLVNTRVDALSVQGELEFEDLDREAYPAYTFSPAEFPGLIK